MIRGTLVEAIPNDHATVELVTGQSAVIPWDRIERIDRGGASRSPAPYYPRAAPRAAPCSPHGPGSPSHDRSTSGPDSPRPHRGGARGARGSHCVQSPCDAEAAARAARIASAARRCETRRRSTSARARGRGPHRARRGHRVERGASRAGDRAHRRGRRRHARRGDDPHDVVAMFDEPDHAARDLRPPSNDGSTEHGRLRWVMVVVAAGAAALARRGDRPVGQHAQQGRPDPGGTPQPRNGAWLRGRRRGTTTRARGRGRRGCRRWSGCRCSRGVSSSRPPRGCGLEAFERRCPDVMTRIVRRTSASLDSLRGTPRREQANGSRDPWRPSIHSAVPRREQAKWIAGPRRPRISPRPPDVIRRRESRAPPSLYSRRVPSDGPFLNQGPASPPLLVASGGLGDRLVASGRRLARFAPVLACLARRRAGGAPRSSSWRPRHSRGFASYSATSSPVRGRPPGRPSGNARGGDRRGGVQRARGSGDRGQVPTWHSSASPLFDVDGLDVVSSVGRHHLRTRGRSSSRITPTTSIFEARSWRARQGAYCDAATPPRSRPPCARWLAAKRGSLRRSRPASLQRARAARSAASAHVRRDAHGAPARYCC